MPFSHTIDCSPHPQLMHGTLLLDIDSQRAISNQNESFLDPLTYHFPVYRPAPEIGSHFHPFLTAQ